MTRRSPNAKLMSKMLAGVLSLFVLKTNKKDDHQIVI